ncbi:MAG: pentapeptide repeat-containing protein [Cyanobacteria bacterium J06600_6]
MIDVAQVVQALLLSIYLTLFLPTFQAIAQTEVHSYLTTEILESRTHNLIQQQGRETIDLSNFIIDLANADSEFNQYFYQEINKAIARVSQPISLNFSDAIIQGDLKLNQLGIASAIGAGVLPTLFTTLEQEKIAQSYPLQSEAIQQIPIVNIFRGSIYCDRTVFTGSVDASNSLYLQSVTASEAVFQRDSNFSQTNFAKELNFSQVMFVGKTDFSHSHFFEPAKFANAEFQTIADFSHSQYEAQTDFSHTLFTELADFTRSVFIDTVDLSQSIFRDRLIFAKSKFLNSLVLVDSSLEKTVTLRDIYLNSLIDLKDAHLLNRLDFSNAFFTPQARINASGLAFDTTEAQIIGQPGIIGKYLNISRLQGNETVFRNLIRNFRSLEQIADANNLEYEQKQLEARAMGDRLTKVSWQKIFTWGWFRLLSQWLILNLLLLLGNYGTNINLIFSLGIMAIALFSVLFWLLDRYRPGISQPVIPQQNEIITMLTSYLAIETISAINILMTADRPWLTIMAIAIILLPVPVVITRVIYQRGRYHELLDRSYFVENAEFREFRLLIGRLPIMPRFPFFRDRFMPILWDRRWSWLNYYDFSLNNIFKLGFNDIRLRDQYVPGLISTLVWYQWCLGVLYIVLLLWTLSRTIPGLNLLIYF